MKLITADSFSAFVFTVRWNLTEGLTVLLLDWTVAKRVKHVPCSDFLSSCVLCITTNEANLHILCFHDNWMLSLERKWEDWYMCAFFILLSYRWIKTRKKRKTKSGRTRRRELPSLKRRCSRRDSLYPAWDTDPTRGNALFISSSFLLVCSYFFTLSSIESKNMFIICLFAFYL